MHSIRCEVCNEPLDSGIIPIECDQDGCPCKGDLRQSDTEVLSDFIDSFNGNVANLDLRENLNLTGRTLELVVEDRVIVLSSNANNANVSGSIPLDDGSILIFDIKGNGSNIKEFRIEPPR